MVNLIDKIEKWWIINFELEINPIEDAAEIDYDGIIPVVIITIRLLVDIALGEVTPQMSYSHQCDKKA